MKYYLGNIVVKAPARNTVFYRLIKAKTDKEALAKLKLVVADWNKVGTEGRVVDFWVQEEL